MEKDNASVEAARKTASLANRVVANAREGANAKKAFENNPLVEEGRQKKGEDAPRLKFTQQERADPALAKHINKADAAADKLDKARLKIPEKKPEGKLKFATRQVKNLGVFAGKEVVRAAHGKVHEVENDNVAVEVTHKAEKLAERGAGRLVHTAYNRQKLKPFRAAAKAEKELIKANANAHYRKILKDNPQLAKANPLKKAWQKRQIKRGYAKSIRAGTVQGAHKAAQAAQATGIKQKIVKLFTNKWKWLVIFAAAILVFVLMFAGMFLCGGMLQGGLNSIIMTSYTAEDEDIIKVDEDYTRLEDKYRRISEWIEGAYPDYDGYWYHLDEVGHDPFELASYLTAKYHDYTPSEVRAELNRIINQQYIVRLEVIPMTSNGSIIHILDVTLENHAISSVAVANLNSEQYEMYEIYMETKGNKAHLFEDNPSVNRGDYTDYDIPPDALTDTKFAAMMQEAEKYLGYPYVWGGSNPSTSFDCSGFVCWVINQSGVGSVGRVNTDGLYDYCTPIPPEEAQPGDLIFFERTYNVSGTSHVGIYVGGGMMIHCGSPISYASVNSSYWQDHFFGYGRLP